MTQGNLFDGDDLVTPPRIQAAARRTDPETSHEAAQNVEANGEASQHRRILAETIEEHPGLTSGELPQHCELLFEQVHKRLKEVERLGHIERGEPRICTVRGNRMLTWWPKGGAPVPASSNSPCELEAEVTA